MPPFLEKKLKSEAVKQGLSGKAVNRYAFGAMNNMGAMRGNVETAKGAAMDAKHTAKMKMPPPAAKAPPMRAAGRQAALASHPNASRLGAYLHPAKKR